MKDKDALCVLDVDLTLDHILSSLPYSIFWKNCHGEILGCNQRHLQVLGFASQEQIIGKTAYDLMSTAQADEITAADAAVMTTGEVKTLEIAAIKADGTKGIFQITKAPLKNKNKVIVGVICISIDITVQKAQEQRLISEKQRAELSNQEKSELLSNVYYDVRAPLSSMLGMAELLLSKLERDDEKDLANYLLIAGRKVSNYINNCIGFSKIEDSTLRLNAGVFDLRDVLCEIHELIAPSVKLKGLEFTVEYDDAIPHHLLGDRDILYCILMNVIDNALKFTHVGFINLSIKLAPYSTAHEPVLDIVLEDSGVGIPKESQKIVFDKFSRLESSQGVTCEGAGIGLYVVRRLVEAMGGGLTLTRSETGGSIFSFRLPFKSENQKNKTTVSDEKKKTSKPSTRILLVEDNHMAQRMARVTLESLGCKVDVADNGEKALDLFEPDRYDLIYMDIGLPDMGGCAVSKAFRKMEKVTGHRVPILAVTAHISSEVKRFCLDAGMDGVLSKPLTLEQAKTSIEKYVFGKSIDASCISQDAGTSETDAELKIIDLQGGADIAGGSIESAQEILHDLYISLSESLSEINTAFELKDMDLLEKIIRRFYGGLCYAGVPRLRQAAKNFQASLLAGEYQQLKPLYKALLDEIDAFKKAYQQLTS